MPLSVWQLKLVGKVAANYKVDLKNYRPEYKTIRHFFRIVTLDVSSPVLLTSLEVRVTFAFGTVGTNHEALNNECSNTRKPLIVCIMTVKP